MVDSTRRPPFDLLSHSESGLTYVRDHRGGVTRVLTPTELDDFNDPPPCASCGEQFGCDHFNCAGEPLLAESELEGAVPAEWLQFARDNGISRNDLERLAKIELIQGEYRLVQGAVSDMRSNELVLLLNDSL